ncbi:cupin domain-containing protein [archaeon]|nr:cupin domain-containing protein [archaeon]
MKLVKENQKEWQDRKGYSKKILYSVQDIPKNTNQLQKMKIPKGNTIANHYHKNTSEIFYCIKGKAVFSIEGNDFEFTKGDAALCEAGEKHEVKQVLEDLHFLTFKINQKENDTVWL